MFEYFAHGGASVREVRVCSKDICWLGCVLAALSGFGCGRDLVVGEWSCEPDKDAAVEDLAVDVPWSTSFEEGFCDYTALAGFCYGTAPARYETVTSPEPVHSGRYAAAFQIQADDPRGFQTRCVRQGKLPTAAYYGAWYFVPATATNLNNWNLIHFQGGEPSGQHGLWDVTLVNGTDGSLEVVVFDFLNGRTRRAATPMPIPIGDWFHLEFYWKRARDASGEVALYQDEQLLVRATGLVTDDSDWGQWYVGNLANGLSPSASTLYVDDVTIRDTR